jgi:hypothetical protein
VRYSRLPLALRVAIARGDAPSIRIGSAVARIERTRLSRALYGEIELEADERQRVVDVFGFDPWASAPTPEAAQHA